MRTIKEDLQSHHFFAILVKVFILLVAILILLFAFLATAPRIALPYLNSHLVKVDDFLTKELGVDVKVTHIDLQWHDYGPVLNIEQLTLAKHFYFNHVKIAFDAWRSVVHHRLQLRKLTIQGGYLAISPAKKGFININSILLPLQLSTQGNADFTLPEQGVVLQSFLINLNLTKKVLLHVHKALIKSADKNHWQVTIDKLKAQSVDIFNQPQCYQQLKLQFSTTSGAIKVHHFTVNSRGLRLSIIGNYANQKYHIQAHLKGQVQQLAHVLPMKLIAPATQLWLQQAFNQGWLSLQLHASSLVAPVISGEVSHVQMHFSPKWPMLKSPQLRINYTRNKITISAAQATVKQLKIHSLSVVIHNVFVKKPYLTLKAMAHDQLQAMLDLILHSPLKANVGKAIVPLQPQGMANLNLFLHVPLNKTVDTSVVGKLRFTNDKLTVFNYAQALQHINGSLSFTQKNLFAKGLTGKLYCQPININITTAHDSAQNSIMQVLAQGEFNKALLQHFIHSDHLNVMQGKAPYRFFVSAQLAGKDSLNTLVQFDSSLKGLSLALPDNLAKTAAQSRPLQVQAILQKKRLSHFDLQYQHALKVDADALATTDKQSAGYVLNINMAQLMLSQWHNFFASRSAKVSASQVIANQVKPYFGKIVSIRANIGQAEVFTQNIKNLQLKIQPQQQAWVVNIDSDVVAGKILSSLNSHSLTLNLSRLYWQQSHKEKSHVAFTTRDVLNAIAYNTVKVNVNNFSYNQYDLGKLNFTLHKKANALTVAPLSLHGKNLSASLQFAVHEQGGVSNVSSQGHIEASHISYLLNQLNLINIQSFTASKANIAYQLSWVGRLDSPDLTHLSGHFSLNLGAGNIADIGHNVENKLELGRLLNALSVESILQKLTFQHDKYRSGYNFNSMKGNFAYQHGVLRTKGTEFDGEVAKVKIAGQVNALSHKLNLRLAVEPKVTGSVPVLAGLVINPAVGLAAWIANLFVSPAVGHATTQHFSLKGSWSDPVVQKIKIVPQQHQS